MLAISIKGIAQTAGAIVEYTVGTDPTVGGSGDGSLIHSLKR